MKRILVTGATGFIGSNLIRNLLDEYEVHIIARQPLNMEYIGELQRSVEIHFSDGCYQSIAEAMENSCPDLVYHLATYYTGAHGPEVTPALIDANITFGAYLLEAMAAYGCRRLIYATTVMEHYQNREYCPLNLYAATKRAFSDLAAYYQDAGMLDLVTLVLTDTYGSGDNRPKILNLIKEAVKEGREIALSAGDQEYDLVYIDDVIRAFRMAGEQMLSGQLSEGKFQIMAEVPLSLRETVEHIMRENGQSSELLLWGERPSSDRMIKKAIRRYSPLPGWKNEVSLDEGGRRFWQ